MSRITVTQLAATVAQIAEAQKAQGEQLAALLAKLSTPSTTTTVAQAVASEPKAEGNVKLLCRKTREAYIKASAYDYKGFSTWEIVCDALTDEARIPAGFGIGAKYRELYAEANA